MEKIELEEQKKILLELLKYIDNICRENNINYSLIGGSLIGAIRHNGIIPWDDDIDIGLHQQDRNKLIEILKRENHEYYKVLDKENSLYPFPKLVDTRTLIIEKDVKKIENYGIYVDIFAYYNAPNNKLTRYIYFKKIEILKKLITGATICDEIYFNEKNFLKVIRNKISRKIGIKKINIKYQNILNKYNDEKTKYSLLDWPCYGYKHEIQSSDNLIEFIDCEFDKQNSMIFKKYDNVLKTTFGDYMTPPPKEKQITNHNTEVYWK